MDFLVTLFLAWLLADFFAGLVHWYEDKCLGDESNNRIVQQIIDENILHHSRPYAMLKHSPWENIEQSMKFAIPLSLILFLVGAHSVVCLAILFAGFGNLVHRWSHMQPRKLNRTIRLFQKVGLFASKEMHDKHHFKNKRVIPKEESKTHYCVMTAYLNPILDGLGFWKVLERVLKV